MFRCYNSIFDNIIVIENMQYNIREAVKEPNIIEKFLGVTWESKLKKAQKRLHDKIEYQKMVDEKRHKVINKVQ